MRARLVNLWLAARRMEFRSYVHSPEQLIAAAERQGLRLTTEHEGTVWRIAGFERPS